MHTWIVICYFPAERSTMTKVHLLPEEWRMLWCSAYLVLPVGNFYPLNAGLIDWIKILTKKKVWFCQRWDISDRGSERLYICIAKKGCCSRGILYKHDVFCMHAPDNYLIGGKFEVSSVLLIVETNSLQWEDTQEISAWNALFAQVPDSMTLPVRVTTG